jgi:glycosyltransferase involved in cell wall biosynthesis
MRIGLISYEYPPQSGFGGVGTYVYRLAGGLAKAGHEVIVLSGPTDAPAEWPQPNVTLHRVQAWWDPPRIPGLRWLWWRGVAQFMERHHKTVWHWLKWNLASPAALLRIHQSSPLDVLEAPEHAANGLMVGRLRRWPLVIRMHGPWDLFFGINRTTGAGMNRVLTYLERRSCDYADVLTAPSRTMAAFMADRWRLGRVPMAIPNFMDVPAEPAPLPPADGPLRIVCAGRLERFKGQDTLVKAFARIASRHTAAELVLIGPDQWSNGTTFGQWIDRWVPEDSIRRRITLTGAWPLPRVQDALRSAAIAVVCSSGFESFSFSTLEAMAHARPIVGSRVGAVPELLDNGRCGLTAAPGNVPQFADALEMLLTDRSLCERLGKTAHERARRCYDTAAVIPAFVDAFETARKTFARRKGHPASRTSV